MKDKPLWTQRCARLWEELEGQRIDGLLVSSPTNVTYLTGFTGDSTYLLVGDSAAVAISDGRYEEQLKEECPGLETVIRATTGEPIEAATARAVARLGWKRLGYESRALTCKQFQALQAAVPNVSWEPAEEPVEKLRAVKEKTEIEAIRTAISVAERAFESALERLDLRSRPVESHFAGVLNCCMRELGATDEAFQTIVASGGRAALPHAGLSTTVRLRLEEGVLCDWGARVGGYVSDLTRLVTTTRIAATLQELIEVVLRARDAAIQALRPGARGQDVDAAARHTIAEAGFGPFFKHSTGHGIGLEVHEAPMLRPGSEVRLQAGMIVTIEPGIYLPGQYGVRIEEDVLITESGPELLTGLPPVYQLG